MPGSRDIDGITMALFYKYAASTAIYKCPADNYLTPVQRAAGITARPRSYSMNSFFGSNIPPEVGTHWAYVNNNYYRTTASF